MVDHTEALYLVDHISYELTGGKLEREIFYKESGDCISLTITKHPRTVTKVFPLTDNKETMDFKIRHMINELTKE
jgi:hypothetical protein